MHGNDNLFKIMSGTTSILNSGKFVVTKLFSSNWRVWNGRGRCYSRVRQKQPIITLSYFAVCKFVVQAAVSRSSKSDGRRIIRQFASFRLFCTDTGTKSSKMSKRESDTQAAEITDETKSDTKSAKKPKLEKEKEDPNAGAIAALAVPEKYTTDRKSEEGNESNLKIASWNVAGLKAWLKKDGISYISKEDPDILFVMETKIAETAVPEEAKVEGYHTYWYGATVKKGYSGTGFYSKKEPISIKYGIDIEEHDGEGRVITAEYDDFYVVGCYVPNSSRGLKRLSYRQEWDIAFHDYLIKLDKIKPLIYCGDFNVAHQEIDLKNPKSNRNKTPGFTDEEREGFSKFLDQGFVDCLRHLYPDREYAYSFWTYMGNCRSKNVGWRLDYFVISKRLVPKLCDSDLRTWILGSDHCPITLDMAM